jgi:hypothetical protein
LSGTLKTNGTSRAGISGLVRSVSALPLLAGDHNQLGLRAASPMTARQITDALLAGKTPVATRKQEEALQAALLAALRVRKGKTVVGEGAPARWRLV